jgi:DNA gyrase subunit A
MGRTARGVRGIRLADNDRVISLLLADDEASVLTLSRHGYGKRTLTVDFPTKGRGTRGVIAMVVNDRNGPLVGAIQMIDSDQVMLISDQGTLVRTRGEEISVLGRNTQGVRIIRLGGDEHLVGVDRVAEADDEELVDLDAADSTPLDDVTDEDNDAVDDENSES